MTQYKRIQFGVEMMGPYEGLTWAASARELETLGYATLFVPDHFDEGLGPLTAMATAAAATTRLRVASAVLAADFRHPAVVARELASIDRLSGGRLEVGIGAGYRVPDYGSSGIRMDPPGLRVARMIEHIRVLKGLWADGPFSFEGAHYQVTSLEGTPKPFRAGGPPIMVGGGSKRLLTFAGSVADIVGVNVALPTSDTPDRSLVDVLPAGIDQKLSWVREGAGARFAALTLHAWVLHTTITDHPATAVEPIAARNGVTPQEVLGSPLVLVGSVSNVVDRLLERRERWGFSYYTITQAHAQEFAPVLRRLATVDEAAADDPAGARLDPDNP